MSEQDNEAPALTSAVEVRPDQQNENVSAQIVRLGIVTDVVCTTFQ